MSQKFAEPLMALAQTVFAVLGVWVVSCPLAWAAVLPLDGLPLPGLRDRGPLRVLSSPGQAQGSSPYVVLQALGLEGKL